MSKYLDYDRESTSPPTVPRASTFYFTMANVQAVLSALEVFSRAPEKAALEQANSWLQDFQHSVIISISPWTRSAPL